MCDTTGRKVEDTQFGWQWPRSRTVDGVMDLSDLSFFRDIIRQALRLNSSVYAAVQVAPNGIYVALFVVALASISGALGQSIVLFINRVRPRRFVLSLGISTANQMLGFVLWAVTVWLVTSYIFGATQSFVAVAAAVGLAYAPQLFAFFELMPFFGNGLAVLLTLWSMLAIVVAVQVGTGLYLWQAVVTSGLGWLLILLWRRSIGRPVYALGNWVERRAAGNPLTFQLDDIPQLRHASEMVQNLEHWRERVSRTHLAELSQRLDFGGKGREKAESAETPDADNREDPENEGRGEG